MRVHRGLPAARHPHVSPGPIDEGQEERKEQGSRLHGGSRLNIRDVAAFVTFPALRLSGMPNRIGIGGPVGDSERQHGIGESGSMGLPQQSLTAGPCSSILAGALAGLIAGGYDVVSDLVRGVGCDRKA
jgi:hypothetical protein